MQNSPCGGGGGGVRGLLPAQSLDDQILHFCVIRGYHVQHLITQIL